MIEEKVFTDQELKAMGERTLDLVLASIEVCDKETAKKLSQRMYNEFSSMHDLYRDWLTDVLSFIGRRFGDEVLYDVMEETVHKGFSKLLAKRYSGKEPHRKLQILATGLRGHLQSLKIEEDREKYTIIVDPCPSGGFQIKAGFYDRSDGFLRIKKAQPMTFNRPEFPVYCAHCCFQNMVIDEISGEPLFITEPGKNIGWDPCRVYIYK